jgi:hypothetical protein
MCLHHDKYTKIGILLNFFNGVFREHARMVEERGFSCRENSNVDSTRSNDILLMVIPVFVLDQSQIRRRIPPWRTPSQCLGDGST